MAISDLIAEQLSQYIINPKVLSYFGSKLNEVQGRFVSANRVYNFVLDKKGVSYSPAGQGDSLLFSALYLRQDAARKPKVGNDKCNAGKSYQCGKICLGNRRKCHKGVRDVNDARRIASILEGTNAKLKRELPSQVSEKALAKGQRLRDNKVKGRALLEERAKNKIAQMTSWQKEFAAKYHAIDSDKKPTQALVRTYSVSNGDGKGSGVTITFDTDVFSDKKLKPILTAYAKDGLLAQVVEYLAPNVLSFRNPDTEILNRDNKHLEVAKGLSMLGIDIKSDQLVDGKIKDSKQVKGRALLEEGAKNKIAIPFEDFKKQVNKPVGGRVELGDKLAGGNFEYKNGDTVYRYRVEPADAFKGLHKGLKVLGADGDYIKGTFKSFVEAHKAVNQEINNGSKSFTPKPQEEQYGLGLSKSNSDFLQGKDLKGLAKGENTKITDDTDALERLEQLVKLGKEVVKPTKTNETVAPSSVLSSYKNAETPSVELAAKVVSELNEIVKTNRQANLPKGVKRHQGYLVADNDFYQAFARTGGEWNSDARSAIRGSTIKSVIDQIKASDPKYFSDKPEDNIILGNKTNRYIVVRRLKPGSLYSPRIEHTKKTPLILQGLSQMTTPLTL